MKESASRMRGSARRQMPGSSSRWIFFRICLRMTGAPSNFKRSVASSGHCYRPRPSKAADPSPHANLWCQGTFGHVQPYRCLVQFQLTARSSLLSTRRIPVPRAATRTAYPSSSGSDSRSCCLRRARKFGGTHHTLVCAVWYFRCRPRRSHWHLAKPIQPSVRLRAPRRTEVTVFYCKDRSASAHRVQGLSIVIVSNRRKSVPSIRGLKL